MNSIVIIIIIFVCIFLIISSYFGIKKFINIKNVNKKYENNSNIVLSHKFNASLKNATVSDYPNRANAIINIYTNKFNQSSRHNKIKLIENVQNEAKKNKEIYKNLSRINARLEKKIKNNETENNKRRTYRSIKNSKAIVQNNWKTEINYQNSEHNI